MSSQSPASRAPPQGRTVRYQQHPSKSATRSIARGFGMFGLGVFCLELRCHRNPPNCPNAGLGFRVSNPDNMEPNAKKTCTGNLVLQIAKKETPNPKPTTSAPVPKQCSLISATGHIENAQSPCSLVMHIQAVGLLADRSLDTM